MKCQSCGKRNAEVHLTEIDANKQKRELHLCEQCHEQQSPEAGMDVLGLLSSAFAKPSGGAPAPVDARCDACGLGYSEFRSRGRLGCPECYEVFREALDPLLEKIHGKRRHVGKAPGDGSRDSRARERKLVELRRKLQEAVESEQYEEAARLRDEVRRREEDLDADPLDVDTTATVDASGELGSDDDEPASGDEESDADRD